MTMGSTLTSAMLTGGVMAMGGGTTVSLAGGRITGWACGGGGTGGGGATGAMVGEIMGCDATGAGGGGMT